MKINYIANIRLPTEKAHGIQIMKMCEAFADLGHEVKLIVPTRKNFIKEDPFHYYSVKGNFNIKYLSIPDTVMFGRIGFWFQNCLFAEVATFYTFFNRADLIYTRDEIIAAYIGLFSKTIYEIHQARFNFLTALAFKFSNKIIVISNGLKEFLKKRGVRDKKIIIARDAVDAEEFKNLTLAEDTRKSINLTFENIIVSYIGKFTTMSEEKGIEQMIEAFVKVFEAYPNARLLLVGANEEEKIATEKIIRKNSLPNGIIVLTHKPRMEAYALMKASNILLMYYPNTEHYRLYMSPLKLFEYMASGVPIISSDLESLREIVSDKTIYFAETDNSAKLSETILKVLDNKEEREEKAMKALEEVTQHSWSKRAQKILQSIYEK